MKRLNLSCEVFACGVAVSYMEPQAMKEKKKKKRKQMN